MILANLHSDEVPNANPSLWLNKFLSEPKTDESKLKHELVKAVVQKAFNRDLQTLYSHFFNNWLHALSRFDARVRDAEVIGRMAVGLGAESVLETSICLHHTYGVPYIPGSALKGLARHFARNVEGWEKEHSEVVFGNHKKDENSFAGYITFFDALPIPNQPRSILHQDIITVHHADYYMSGNVPPADWDDPTPIPFLSATGTYLIAVAGPSEWIQPCFRLLELALLEEGIGSKTSSGYGRLKLLDNDQLSETTRGEER
jgi:CRISPR-associated protein Cmr6